MAKDIGPKCKKCRAEGEKLFLKGDRCHTPKCAVVKRNYVPGQHGPNQNRKISEYGTQLREKQKAKKIYNILEKQLRNYYNKASKKAEQTGDSLIKLLEKRLDNVVYRLTFAKSRSMAREIVSHGHILVNGKKVTIPSYSVRVGDIISVSDKAKKKKAFAGMDKFILKDEVPKWLEVDAKKISGKVIAEPEMDDVGHKIDLNLIVEFYSR